MTLIAPSAPLVRTAAGRDMRDVRPLLARRGHFRVRTAVFALHLARVLVREQFKNYDDDNVRWTMAMFDVKTAMGDVARTGLGSITADISEGLARRYGNAALDLQGTLHVVMPILERVYGQQLTVTGWLPGYRTAEGRNVLELTGDVCPSCTTNPTGYKVGDQNVARCLNSEDCGWTSSHSSN